ncbi:hypothetical protein [Undibacterium curvum]
MWLLLLEAAIALGILIFIVWWTMFSGRPQRPPRHKQPTKPEDTENSAS